MKTLWSAINLVRESLEVGRLFVLPFRWKGEEKNMDSHQKKTPQMRSWSLDWNSGKKVWAGVQGAKLEEEIFTKDSLETKHWAERR